MTLRSGSDSAAEEILRPTLVGGRKLRRVDGSKSADKLVLAASPEKRFKAKLMDAMITDHNSGIAQVSNLRRETQG